MPGRSLVNQRLRRDGKPFVVLAALAIGTVFLTRCGLASHPRTSLARSPASPSPTCVALSGWRSGSH